MEVEDGQRYVLRIVLNGIIRQSSEVAQARCTLLKTQISPLVVGRGTPWPL